LGEKKGASKGKLANCTKMPVQPESAMRGEGVMRADKTECAEGRPERCGAMVGDRGGEKGNCSETGRLRESKSKCTRKDREGEAGARGARCANGEGSNASNGEKGSGSVEVEAEAETRVDEGLSESASELSEF
jgi:hypothetical protein